jgi:hypothetical protein
MATRFRSEAEALKEAIQRIRQLCETVNTLDKLRGGNGRKCRVVDFLEGLENVQTQV